MVAVGGDAIDVFEQEVARPLHLGETLPPQGLEPSHQEIELSGSGSAAADTRGSRGAQPTAGRSRSAPPDRAPSTSVPTAGTLITTDASSLNGDPNPSTRPLSVPRDRLDAKPLQTQNPTALAPRSHVSSAVCDDTERRAAVFWRRGPVDVADT